MPAAAFGIKRAECCSFSKLFPIFQNLFRGLIPSFLRSGPYYVTERYGPVEKIAKADFTMQSRANLDITDAAVLYLLDTCYASGLTTEYNREVFAAAATGTELPTAGTDSSNWTKELCRHLQNVKGTPITVAQLHGMMMQSLADGKLAVTPVHSEPTPSMQGRSIVLAPLILSRGGVPANSKPYREEEVFKEEGNPRQEQPMVLISVQLEEKNMPKASNSIVVEELKDWLIHVATTHRPSSMIRLMIMKIEVVEYRSSFPRGILLLITLPIPVWVCLRGDPAYCFVRFVRTTSSS